MRHFLFLFLAPSLLAAQNDQAPTSPSDSLTVNQAIRLVLDHHPSMKQALEAARTAAARADITYSSLYPSVGTDLQYTRIGPVPSLSVPGLGAFKLYPEDNYDAHIAVRGDLFDFGKRSASVDAALAGVATMEDRVNIVRSHLAFQTAQAFYSILFLNQSIVVQQQQIEALNHHLTITQKRMETGSATDFDLLTTQVRIAASRNVLIDLQTRQKRQELLLKRLLTDSSDTPLALRGRFDLMPVSLNIDSLLAVAEAHRAELKAGKDARTAATLQLKLASAEYMPVLRATLAYGVKNGFIPNLDVLRGNWVAGVQLSVPLFDGFRTSAKEREAQASIRGSEAALEEAEQSVETDVKLAVENLRSTLERIQSADLQVQQAEAAVSNARLRYQTGVITNLDLLDAETALAQAKLARLQVLYEYVVGRYGLDQAVGLLPE